MVSWQTLNKERALFDAELPASLSPSNLMINCMRRTRTRASNQKSVQSVGRSMPWHEEKLYIEDSLVVCSMFLLTLLLCWGYQSQAVVVRCISWSRVRRLHTNNNNKDNVIVLQLHWWWHRQEDNDPVCPLMAKLLKNSIRYFCLPLYHTESIVPGVRTKGI